MFKFPVGTSKVTRVECDGGPVQLLIPLQQALQNGKELDKVWA